MSCKDFIITYLDLEKNKNIEKLMKVNLNNNLELGEASTKISNGIDEIIDDNENEDEMDKEIKKGLIIYLKEESYTVLKIILIVIKR